MKFKINGWVSDLIVELYESSCGGEKGLLFREGEKPGGVMPYSEIRKLIDFLTKKLPKK